MGTRMWICLKKFKTREVKAARLRKLKGFSARWKKNANYTKDWFMKRMKFSSVLHNKICTYILLVRSSWKWLREIERKNSRSSCIRCKLVIFCHCLYQIEWWPTLKWQRPSLLSLYLTVYPISMFCSRHPAPAGGSRRRRQRPPPHPQPSDAQTRHAQWEKIPLRYRVELSVKLCVT